MLLTFRLLRHRLSLSLTLTHGCVFPSIQQSSRRKEIVTQFFSFLCSDNAASYSVEPNQTRLFTSPEKLRALDIFVSFSIKVNAQSPALPHSLLFWSSSSSSLRSRTFHGTAPQSWMLYIQQMNVSRCCCCLLSTFEPSSNNWRAATSYN